MQKVIKNQTITKNEVKNPFIYMIYKENKKLSTGKNRFFPKITEFQNPTCQPHCKLLISYVIMHLLSREGVAERLLRLAMMFSLNKLLGLSRGRSRKAVKTNLTKLPAASLLSLERA